MLCGALGGFEGFAGTFVLRRWLWPWVVEGGLEAGWVEVERERWRL